VVFALVDYDGRVGARTQAKLGRARREAGEKLVVCVRVIVEHL